GTSWGHIRRLLQRIDSIWAQDHIRSGLSSGEGLIWAVRDSASNSSPPKGSSRRGSFLLVEGNDQGIIDKRLLVLESEFASVLKVLNREGNTLSAVIRNAWDTGDLNILVKNSPTKATDAHISIISHVTRNELLVYLDDVEAGNGFGNRFLWAFAQRSKFLPEGGQLDDSDVDSVVAKVKAAVDFAGNVGRVSFDTQARKLWRDVYPKLSDGKPGLVGSLIARAEAQ